MAEPLDVLASQDDADRPADVPGYTKVYGPPPRFVKHSSLPPETRASVRDQLE